MNDVTRTEVAQAYGFSSTDIPDFVKKMSKERDRYYSPEEIAARIVLDLGISGTQDPTPFGTVGHVFVNLVSSRMSSMFGSKKQVHVNGFDRTKRTSSAVRPVWHYRYREPKIAPLPPPAAAAAPVDILHVLTRIAVAQERIAAALETPSSVSFS